MAKKQNRFLKDLAQGAILSAKGQDKIPEFMEDLALFSSILESDHGVRKALANVSVPQEKRSEALKRILGEQLEPISLKTIDLLMEHHLMGYFDDFHAIVEQKARENANYHICRVRSAISLNDTDRQDLKKALEKRLSGTVKLRYEIDSSVLGGLSVTCGDWRYLGTVQAKLQQLGRHLITN